MTFAPRIRNTARPEHAGTLIHAPEPAPAPATRPAATLPAPARPATGQHATDRPFCITSMENLALHMVQARQLYLEQAGRLSAAGLISMSGIL